MPENEFSLVFADPDSILNGAEAESRVVLDNYYRSMDLLVTHQLDRMDECYKSYRSFVEIDDDAVQSSLFRPLIFGAVETFLPRLVVNLPRIEVGARHPEDELRAAQQRNLIFYDWDILKMALVLINWAKAGEIYGTAWAKTTHRKEVRDRLVRRPRNPALTNFSSAPSVQRILEGLPTGIRERLQAQVGGFVEEVEPVPVWDDPWIELLEGDEVFPDPDGKDEQSCSWIIHRRLTNLDEIENARYRGEPLYKPGPVAKLKKALKANNPMSSPDFESLKSRRQQLFLSQVEAHPDPHKRQFHILEQWTDGKVTTIVEELPEIPPLRAEPNRLGRKPFSRFTPIPIPNELYGISVPEILYSLNLEVNTLANARVDTILQHTYTMMSIIRGSNLNPNDIRWRSSGHFLVDSHDDYRFAKPPSLDFSSYREQEDLRMWAQWASGATDTFAGLGTDLTGGTATEAALLSQASGSRAGLMFQILSLQALKDFGRLLIRINEMHIDDEKFIRVAGSEFTDPRTGEQSPYLNIKPEEIVSRTGLDLDVVIDVAETEPANLQFRMQRALNGLGVLSNFLPPNHPVMERLMADLMRGLGVERPEVLIEAGRQAAQQFSVMQAQPGGGQAPAESPSQATTEGQQIAADTGAESSLALLGGRSPAAGVQ